MSALPLVVLLEYFHSCYTYRSDEWLRARIRRINILIHSNFFAEAAAMIAGIRSSIANIEQRIFHNPITAPSRSDNIFGNVSEYDSHTNGFDFFQYAPYYNHLPPHDDQNKPAIDWIGSYPKHFRDFAQKYTSSSTASESDMSPVLGGNAAGSATSNIASGSASTTGQPNAGADAKKLPPATKEKAPPAKKDAKKGNAKDASAPGASPVTADDKQAVSSGGLLSGVGNKEGEIAMISNESLFPPIFEVQIGQLCSLFLLKLAELDIRITTPYYDRMSFISNTAKTVNVSTLKTISILSSIPDKKSINNNDEIIVFNCISQIISLRLHLIDRNAMHAYGGAQLIIDNLKSIAGPLSAEVSSDLSQIWFEVRKYQLEVADRHARFSEEVDLASNASVEAASICSGYWIRTFLYYRAKAYLKMGDMNTAISDCDAIISKYDEVGVNDVIFPRVLALKATILRSTCLSRPSNEFLQKMFLCKELLQRAKSIALSIATEYGFIGCDANLTTQKVDSTIMRHVAKNPVVHNMSSYRDNFPVLSLEYRNRKKPTVENEIIVDVTNDLKYVSRDSREYTTGPIDKDVEYVMSEFANIYLRSVRILCTCCTSLVIVLEDILSSGLCDNTNSSESKGECMTTQSVVHDESLCCEEGLKVRR